MLGNLPLVQNIRRWNRKNQIYPPEGPTLFDFYNEINQEPWNVIISKYDKMKIEFAISRNKSIRLTEGLSDVQLLKLHALSFPEYDNQLIYHKMFDMYEVKYNKMTTHLFSYRDGIYTPINSVM